MVWYNRACTRYIGVNFTGNKLRMSLGLPTAALINCADNSGAKNLYIIAVTQIGARLNRLPAACMCLEVCWGLGVA